MKYTSIYHVLGCIWVVRGLESAALRGQFVGEMGVYPGKLVHVYLLAELLYMFRMGLSCCMSNGMDRSTNVLSCLKWCLWVFLRSAQICSDKFWFRSWKILFERCLSHVCVWIACACMLMSWHAVSGTECFLGKCFPSIVYHPACPTRT